MTVNYQYADGISQIKFDDGKANALSLEAIKQLNAALDQALSDGGITIISGREGIFSAGFHMGELAQSPLATVQLLRAGAEFCTRLLRFPLPVISACSGHAFPMGAFILLSSDFRFGIDGPFQIGLNEVRVNMTIPYFALELARGRLHPAYFQRTAVTGELYTPSQAVAAGFLDELVTADNLMDSALEKAHSYKDISFPHHAATKLRARARWLEAIEDGIESELTLENAQQARTG
jgi:enoyl-CoA hydratase